MACSSSQSDLLHGNYPIQVRAVRSQDGPPRVLRNVPAFRDLRNRLPASGRVGPNHTQLIGDSHGDEYELTGVDTIGTRPEPTATSPRRPSLSWPNRRDIHGIDDEEDEGENLINIDRPQHLFNSSEDTITHPACSRAAIWKEIQLPLLWIHGSMLLILASLAVLVSVYRVKPEKGLFFEPTGWSNTRQKKYLLLRIPASTKLHRFIVTWQ